MALQLLMPQIAPHYQHRTVAQYRTRQQTRFYGGSVLGSRTGILLSPQRDATARAKACSRLALHAPQQWHRGSCRRSYFDHNCAEEYLHPIGPRATDEVESTARWERNDEPNRSYRVRFSTWSS